MTNKSGYEYLPHIADVRFKAYGSTLEHVFEQAALAMFNVIIDTSVLKPLKTVGISVESTGLDDLLYDYLSELLYLFEVESIIFGHFTVNSINMTNKGYTLSGQASGEITDLKKHCFDCEVKAVTYHQLKIEKIDGGYCAHVIVDT
ncbi:MAG: archease [Methanosarcinales archaeon]|jgi:SHS2 domain-containing protein|nr:archease [Methanosarcinales archaeon]